MAHNLCDTNENSTDPNYQFFQVNHKQVRVFQKQWCSKHADLSDHYALEAELQLNSTVENIAVTSTD